ncbi:MAG TPA: hypothetical protein EYO30_05690 [Gemmatimonadetes bacterium]|jgi:2'-5' RNA ligase|nr:hypothetical protein [Gemmatimonadota bacterium]
MNQPNYSIWLLPSETDKLYLSQTIQPLGKKYDAPVFDPHCTLFSPITDPESAKTIIDQLNFKPFEVTMSGLNQSDNIWKTLFIELENNAQMTILNQLFSQTIDFEYDFQPHISLIYKELNMNTKKTVIEKLIVKNSYRMGSIAIVDTSGPVEDWKIVYEVKLSPG